VFHRPCRCVRIGRGAMGDFQGPRPLPQPRRIAELTPEAQNYKAFKVAFKQTEASRIVGVSFSAAPHRLAVVSGTKVGIFKHAKEGRYEADSNVSKFKDLAQCAAWRSDGKLMLAGEASGTCAVIETETRKVLRRLRGHNDAVVCAAFAAADKTRCATGATASFAFGTWPLASYCGRSMPTPTA